MIALGRRTDEELEDDYLEESGSYQRLVAAMIDSDSLLVDPDPVLNDSTVDRAGEELLRSYSG